MSDATPSGPRDGATPEGSGGCLGAFLLLAFWSTIWLGLCFLAFWKLGTAPAAAIFFAPPLGFFLWVIFTKPAGGGGLDRKQ
ncbi:MAG: hypothetical protein KIS92_13645 [Planctomycetota bacterium]|nr:hypothetical protein [Planctomycetota bacterium]